MEVQWNSALNIYRLEESLDSGGNY